MTNSGKIIKHDGQIAYEAYCDSVGWVSVGGDKLPSWGEQSERLQTAWSKAALAVNMNHASEFAELDSYRKSADLRKAVR